MPRPCQRRRAVAAHRNPNPKPKAKAKSAAPPPIRHKARQKAIHNARRAQNKREQEDFVAASNRGNNFGVLPGRGHARGSQYDPIALDDVVEDGEVSDDDDTDEMDEDDDDDGDMMINVQEYRGKVGTREVMFTEGEAVGIYRELWLAGFPLLGRGVGRFGGKVQVTNAVGLEPYSRLAFSRSDTTIQPETANPKIALSKTSSNTSQAPVPPPRRKPANTAPKSVRNPAQVPYHPAHDYKFDFGTHRGKTFLEAPENYLRTIGGQAMVFDGRHKGLKEAFDYYRPGRRSTIVDDPPQFEEYKQPPPQFLAPRAATDDRWEDYQLPKGRWLGKRLDQVPEDYLRTLEGMLYRKQLGWEGLRAALVDFNQRTGREGKLQG
ncbi:hypothetical protein P153DRAFT_81789 [Dothidotthia symphoricarpi CBS 119687]|uniref:Uncharacterized protein n=1 Tax=Dothidotthia symphoricarpi CBS 119687 TaxID=1392245 RepID=A0A6A6A675_9PLEO|nr:uncharacterized protein P153DRAFT_81789 [Dothidotthia symphoricarpi CBS 119687]KAF2126653.1 hypothetical protein P153DRAFT_81789 [Dothidotthia symphoricarpi CBS 119687]